MVISVSFASLFLAREQIKKRSLNLNYLCPRPIDIQLVRRCVGVPADASAGEGQSVRGRPQPDERPSVSGVDGGGDPVHPAQPGSAGRPSRTAREHRSGHRRSRSEERSETSRQKVSLRFNRFRRSSLSRTTSGARPISGAGRQR